ncbi:MAG: glycosyltransferase [Erysipelotrichaceae bacterium]|nr:glycosyltransferase [Erysipelotrichaceae bacterium]
MLVSIVIPIYNSEVYLEKCLDSLIQQTYQQIEIICVNDGSTDGSLDCLNKYGIKDKRLKIITIENAGQGNARNVGMLHASGEYLMFVDSDDYVDKDYVERYVECVSDYDLVYGYIHRIFEDRPNYLEKSFKYQTSESQKEGRVNEVPSVILDVINAPYAKLIRKSFLLEHEVFFPVGMIYEDAVFTQKLLSYNPKVYGMDYMGYQYIVHKGSTMTNNRKITDMFKAAELILNQYQQTPYYSLVKQELDYYIFHHVAIGLVYRQFKFNPFKVIKMMKETKTFLKKHHIDLKKNVYLKRQGFIIKSFYQFYRG